MLVSIVAHLGILIRDIMHEHNNISVIHFADFFKYVNGLKNMYENSF